jgi:molecular chaperone HtpG
VADNLQEFIPEFLLLLRGGIDIPDIPLNVSRSFLQQDQNVRKISRYIIKKVSDYLNELFKEDRKKFEQYWENIHQFIKFGAITEESFYEGVKDIIIFKNAAGEYRTLQEYKSSLKDDQKPQKLYYAAGEDTQVSYLNMMKEAGKEVIIASDIIDTHLFQHLEMKNGDLVFTRIDSQLDDDFVEKDKQELVDSDNKTELDRLKDIFEKGLDNKEIKIEVKRLKNKDIPGLVVFNEFMRRMQDMNSVISGQESSLLQNHEFIVNADNPIVKKILKFQATGKEDKVKLLCHYLHNLSLMEQKQFSGKELGNFVKETYKILDLI